MIRIITYFVIWSLKYNHALIQVFGWNNELDYALLHPTLRRKKFIKSSPRSSLVFAGICGYLRLSVC